ncbi:hypothetical protein AX15_001646 [Amanita polypyramis BW_CC]|nr:hypothetical protein AX15_001646 [Amanita polypyramis BW_CC]
MSATLELGAPLDNTMGVMFISLIVTAVLHGMALVQAQHYYTVYPNDITFTKTMVGIMVVIDFFHFLLTGHALYDYLITQYYDHLALQRLTWSITLETVFCGLNCGLVQIYYALRVWRLSHNIPLLGLICALILAENVVGIAFATLAFQTKTFFEFLRITPWAISINALAATVDIAIAISITVLLRRSRTGSVRTDKLTNRLIIFTINTGLLTSSCALCALVSLVVSDKILIYSAFHLSLGGLYTNSFLVVLNVRQSLLRCVDESTPQFTTVECSNLPIVSCTNSASSVPSSLANSDSL